MPQTLAILSPSQNAYSETFIQAHRNLPFAIKYYYGGYLPRILEGGESLIHFNLAQRIKKKFTKRFDLFEFALANSLKREMVDCVLAEYGPTACKSLNVLEYLKLPLVVHFHGYDASIKSVLEEYEESYKKVFAYASAIVVVSKRMEQTLINLGCPKDKLIISVYGPNPGYFDVQPLYNTQQFISVGRFIEKKAPDLSIRAFQKVVTKFPAAKLVMVGEGELLAGCKNLVNELGLEKNVEFKGIQNLKEIQSLMSESIAMVQHSVTASNGDAEGTPVAILEAQAAALPVISTYHAGIPDVVIQNQTGLLVQEGDVEGMAKNMERMLAEENLAKKMGESGRSRTRENFTLETHLGILQKEIEKLKPNKV